MATRSQADRFREKGLREKRRLLGERMDDFSPRIVTPVIREQTDLGWRVVMLTFPPTLLGEGLTEQEAVEVQAMEVERLGRLIPVPVVADDRDDAED